MPDKTGGTTMKRSRFIPLVAIAVSFGLMGPEAIAAEFSPTITFKLSDNKTGANPSLDIQVAQEKDEEELKSVSLEVPAGFTLPLDAQIPNNTQLGSGTIIIDIGPRCSNPSNPLSAPGRLPATIKELDRDSADTAEGAIAKWLVDIQSVTSIELLVKGSTADGYTLAGDIPANANTCPPFSFTATIQAKAAGVEILKNPATPGTYTFGATFTGLGGSTAKITQPVEITGAGGGGDTGTTGLTKAEKKKCLKKKTKKARKACIKKQRRD
jgi:hypothetical protein